jgi:hypothetical protein
VLASIPVVEGLVGMNLFAGDYIVCEAVVGYLEAVDVVQEIVAEIVEEIAPGEGRGEFAEAIGY